MPSRTLRYSGSERPAWRMNHTGVCGTGSRRQALRNAESVRPGWAVAKVSPATTVSAVVPRPPGAKERPSRPTVRPMALSQISPISRKINPRVSSCTASGPCPWRVNWRQECREEHDHLRVGEVGQHRPLEHLPVRRSSTDRGGVAGGAQGCQGQPGEVGRAGKLDGRQHPWGGAQQHRQPERGGGDVDDHAQGHPGRREHAGTGAAGQGDAGDVGVVRAGSEGDEHDCDQETRQHCEINHRSSFVTYSDSCTLQEETGSQRTR